MPWEARSGRTRLSGKNARYNTSIDNPNTPRFGCHLCGPNMFGCETAIRRNPHFYTLGPWEFGHNRRECPLQWPGDRSPVFTYYAFGHNQSYLKQ